MVKYYADVYEDISKKKLIYSFGPYDIMDEAIAKARDYLDKNVNIYPEGVWEKRRVLL